MWAAIILQGTEIKSGDYIMIQTYFGNGKGKTTAAVGSAVRCAGCGNKVLFVQFLKNNDSAEFSVLSKITYKRSKC